MEIQEIINCLKERKSGIIKKLSEKRWEHFRDYFQIREKYLSHNLDDKFRRLFCRFYIMNGLRGLNKYQKNEFFKLLSSRETDLEIILRSLYDIDKNRPKLFLSFGTKLLHTINSDLPIYDRNISCILELPKPHYNIPFKEKIKDRINIYQSLKNKFNELLSDVKITSIMKSYKEELQCKTELKNFNKYVSDTKLLDSLLWALYYPLK